MIALARIVVQLLAGLAGFVVLLLAPRRSVAAENLFLRRQLALFLERGDQRWSAFLRNHADAIVACDFFVAVTAHPTAAWSLQQLGEVVGFDRAHQYLIHDRDSIFARSLDWLIPLPESHLRSILRAWAAHYNHGRPHMALGPGVPDPPSEVVPSATPLTRHRIGEHFSVRARSVLGGLHHEYLPAPAWA